MRFQGNGRDTLCCSNGGCRCKGRSSSAFPSSQSLAGGRRRKTRRRAEPRLRRKRSQGPEPPCTQTGSGLVQFTLSGSGLDCLRFTWGHRGRGSLDTKARSGILGTRSQACACKAWDWQFFAMWVERLPVHCGGCSKALGSGILGNAAGRTVQ